jgi:hypothetical protein
MNTKMISHVTPLLWLDGGEVIKIVSLDLDGIERACRDPLSVFEDVERYNNTFDTLAGARAEAAQALALDPEQKLTDTKVAVGFARAAKEALPAWCPGLVLRGARRDELYAIGRSMLGLDFDKLGVESDAAIPRIIRALLDADPALRGCGAVIHASPSHVPNTGMAKVRVFVPLDGVVPASDWARAQEVLCRIPGNDESTHDIVRLFYSPLRGASVWRLPGAPCMIANLPALADCKPRAVASKRADETTFAVAPVVPGTPEEAARIAEAIAMLQASASAIEGQGGSRVTFIVAQRLVRSLELPIDTALALLAEHYNTRCRPPWSESELRHKLVTARNSGTFETRSALIARAAAIAVPLTDEDRQARITRAVQWLKNVDVHKSMFGVGCYLTRVCRLPVAVAVALTCRYLLPRLAAGGLPAPAPETLLGVFASACANGTTPLGWFGLDAPGD